MHLSLDHKDTIEGEKSLVEISPLPLDLTSYVNWVGNPTAGAIATFTGTTRNTFEGKSVLKLEYEAYTPMALSKMVEICEMAAERWQIVRIAIGHRIGTVGIGEASVVIAASSAHRAAALEAVHWSIDELKATVPIWKKEFFEGGEVWKENAESRQRLMQQ